ncbi:UNVERIFIED_CONTAM: hypothetical protein Sindi_1626900, partial [Sesamum indicum]
ISPSTPDSSASTRDLKGKQPVDLLQTPSKRVKGCSGFVVPLAFHPTTKAETPHRVEETTTKKEILPNSSLSEDQYLLLEEGKGSRDTDFLKGVPLLLDMTYMDNKPHAKAINLFVFYLAGSASKTLGTVGPRQDMENLGEFF